MPALSSVHDLRAADEVVLASVSPSMPKLPPGKTVNLAAAAPLPVKFKLDSQRRKAEVKVSAPQPTPKKTASPGPAPAPARVAAPPVTAVPYGLKQEVKVSLGLKGARTGLTK